MSNPDSENDRPTRVDPLQKTGRRIGPYEILDRLGEGGMGEVYLAWQTEPVRRKVALKVIKGGMNTREVVARFESERQALALMGHPFIARILDGGATEDGLPFFVMEHVEGTPVTDYCDRNRLSARDRLKLFVQVCEAVQHAHHKAIVHRDLKPSNILVSEQDGKPFPKIIDFGVAKALGEPLTPEAVHTRIGQFVGTPKYMSPEQVDARRQSVDTRSDVYSLGVVLYELMVGSTPLDEPGTKATPLDELVRRIREEDPELPSRRLSSLGSNSLSVARLRGTHPVNLKSQLEGELDWITMKALAKNRNRRYGSPSELADDIQRYLNDEIVQARPSSLAYRAGKFVRRHRLLVTAATLVFLSAVVLAAIMTIQAQRFARERDRANLEAETARQVSEFLTNLFRLSDPMIARGEQPTAREILDRGTKQIESELTEQPLVLARLQSTMAKAYENLGLYDQAEALYQAVLERQMTELGPENIETVSTGGELANLHWRQGKLEQAETELRATIEAKTRLLGEEDPSLLQSQSNLASLSLVQGRYAEAEQIYRRCFEKMRRVLGEEDPRTVGVANNLALVYSSLGEFDRAEELYRRVLETRLRLDGKDHPNTLGAAFNLAEYYLNRNRIDEAEGPLLDVLERRLRVLGEDHPDTLTTRNSLGKLYSIRGNTARAKQYLRAAYDGRERALGKKHPDTLATGYELGRLLLQEGRTEEAVRMIREAMTGLEEQLGPGHPHVLAVKGGLARVHYARKEFAEAEQLFRQQVEGLRQYGEDHPDLFNSLFNLACVSALQGKSQQALGFLKEAVRLGFDDSSAFEDTDLASLRNDPEFTSLVGQVRTNASREAPSAAGAAGHPK